MDDKLSLLSALNLVEHPTAVRMAHQAQAVRHDLPDAVEWFYLVGGFLLGIFALALIYRVCRPQSISGNPDEETFRTLVGWEQARAVGCAKGVATTSAGFLVATATALVKNELEAPSVLALVGSMCGAIGLLVLSVVLSRDAMVFALTAFGYQPESE